jgi:hypothetical protein
LPCAVHILGRCFPTRTTTVGIFAYAAILAGLIREHRGLR